MVAALAPDFERLGGGRNPAFIKGEVGRQVEEQRVAPLPGLEGQGEGAVGVDVDAGDRIHLNGDLEGHGQVLFPEYLGRL